MNEIITRREIKIIPFFGRVRQREVTITYTIIFKWQIFEKFAQDILVQ